MADHAFPVSGWVPRWGLAGAAAAFWAGILLAGSGRGHPGPGRALGAVIAGLGAMLLAVALGRRVGAGWLGAVSAPVALWLSFGLLGAGWWWVRDGATMRSALSSLGGSAVLLRGSLADEPTSGGLGWTATLHPERLDRIDGEPADVPLSGSVWIEGRGPRPRWQAGRRVEADGDLESLRGDFGVYLRHRGYTATLRVIHLDDRGPPTNPLMRLAGAIRAGLRSSLERVLPGRDAGLVLGLVLGDTSRLDPGIEDSFRATGLSHLTAVSGENLAMFLAPVLGLAAAAGLGRRGRFAVGLIAIAFFVMLTAGAASVMRAAVMAGITLLGVFLGRPRSPPAVVGGAVLALLAWDPTLVWAVGFQLSVGATVGMATLARPIAGHLGSLPEGLALAAATTLSAQAGVLPLLLFYFGVVPLVTVPANLLAFPAVGAAMLLGLAAGATGLVWRTGGILVAGLARIPLGYLEGLARRLARWPLPSITSGGGRAWTLVAGFGVLLLVTWLLRDHARSRRALAALGLALPVFVWSGAAHAGPPAVLTVVFFDVGQGDAALIRSPGGVAILIDGGPDPLQVSAKLAALGIRRLDLMVATHPHADHVAGLPAVLTRFPVALVADSGCRGTSPFYRGFLAAVRALHEPLAHPRPGQVLRVGDVRLEVLGPEACAHGTDSDPNNDSMILRVSDGRNSVLFPGDAEVPEQQLILADRGTELSAPLLKVPHHGGNTSLPGFLAATRARVAVISVGQPNRYGHPSPELLALLARDGMRVFRTDRSGDLTVRFVGTELDVMAGMG